MGFFSFIKELQQKKQFLNLFIKKVIVYQKILENH